MYSINKISLCFAIILSTSFAHSSNQEMDQLGMTPASFTNTQQTVNVSHSNKHEERIESNTHHRQADPLATINKALQLLFSKSDFDIYIAHSLFLRAFQTIKPEHIAKLTHLMAPLEENCIHGEIATHGYPYALYLIHNNQFEEAFHFLDRASQHNCHDSTSFLCEYYYRAHQFKLAEIYADRILACNNSSEEMEEDIEEYDEQYDQIRKMIYDQILHATYVKMACASINNDSKQFIHFATELTNPKIFSSKSTHYISRAHAEIVYFYFKNNYVNNLSDYISTVQKHLAPKDKWYLLPVYAFLGRHELAFNILHQFTNAGPKSGLSNVSFWENDPLQVFHSNYFNQWIIDFLTNSSNLEGQNTQ